MHSDIRLIIANEKLFKFIQFLFYFIMFNFSRMIIRYCLAVLLLGMALLPSAVLAQTINKENSCCNSISSPWFVTGELGYAKYSDKYHRDGQTPLGRFAIGRDLGKASIFNFSLEAGIQNGNTMRFPIDDPEHHGEFGNVSTVVAKPIVDLLLAVKTDPLNDEVPVFALFKVGPAYQRWVFANSNAVDDKEKVSLEAQVGLGYWINNHTNISLSYQRIFGMSPNFYVRTDDDITYGSISNIPTQQAVLFGISTIF